MIAVELCTAHQATVWSSWTTMTPSVFPKGSPVLPAILSLATKMGKLNRLFRPMFREDMVFLESSPMFRSKTTHTTLQGTNISSKNGILKMIFLFPRWDMLTPWRVNFPEPSFWLKSFWAFLRSCDFSPVAPNPRSQSSRRDFGVQGTPGWFLNLNLSDG